VHRFERCSTRRDPLAQFRPGRADACHLDPSVRVALREGSAA